MVICRLTRVVTPAQPFRVNDLVVYFDVDRDLTRATPRDLLHGL